MQYYGARKQPKAINEILEELDYSVKDMGPRQQRGMVLCVWKAKVLKVIGCESKDFYICKGIVPYVFDAERVACGDWYLRRINRSGLSEEKRARRRSLLSDLQGAKLTQRSKKDFEHPALCIYLRDGSPWRAELHARRYQIMMLLNKRLEDDFLREVVIR